MNYSTLMVMAHLSLQYLQFSPGIEILLLLLHYVLLLSRLKLKRTPFFLFIQLMVFYQLSVNFVEFIIFVTRRSDVPFEARPALPFDLDDQAFTILSPGLYSIHDEERLHCLMCR